MDVRYAVVHAPRLLTQVQRCPQATRALCVEQPSERVPPCCWASIEALRACIDALRASMVRSAQNTTSTAQNTTSTTGALGGASNLHDDMCSAALAARLTPEAQMEVANVESAKRFANMTAANTTGPPNLSATRRLSQHTVDPFHDAEHGRNSVEHSHSHVPAHAHSPVPLRSHSPTSRHSHSPTPTNRHEHAPVRRAEALPQDAGARGELASLLSGTALYRAVGPSLEDAEVGVTAKFADGLADDLDRAYVCTHKCAASERCPPTDKAMWATRLALRGLDPPPLVEAWLNIIDGELAHRPERLPQLCVGASSDAGKLYLGGLHEGGVGLFPDLPLARNASLHSFLSSYSHTPRDATKSGGEGGGEGGGEEGGGGESGAKLTHAAAAQEGEIVSLEWRVGDAAGHRRVALRRYHTPRGMSSMDVMHEWAGEVGARAKPHLLQRAWAAVAQAKSLTALQLIYRTAPYDPSVAARPPPLRPTTVAVEPTVALRRLRRSELLPAQYRAMQAALAPLFEQPQTMKRAAAWATKAATALAGRSYTMHVAQLSVSANGSLVAALYHMAMPASMPRRELEPLPTHGSSGSSIRGRKLL